MGRTQGGHVFIIQGDITQLACDAWLMPCNPQFRARENWFSCFPQLHRQRPQWEEPDTRFDRVRRVRNWPAGKPLPFMTNMGGTPADQADWYLEGVRQFLNAAGALKKAERCTRRSRPLIALPVVGTGAGGASERIGEIVADLLPELYRFVNRRKVDVVLVTRDGPAFAAATHERRKLGRNKTGCNPWPKELSRNLRKRAEGMASLAQAGNLVLFLGAGVSVGAGLPSWGALLAMLAKEAGLPTPDKLGKELGYLDLARLISERLGEDSIQEKIGHLLAPFTHHSLSHGLLAGLPVSQVITTNYDTLFETASTGAALPPAVLPYEPAQNCPRWLLKMHGCVKHPEDIVITRSDYLRYDDTRAALKGLVQAMLMTQHMLFVGFSMTDDNFHRVIDDVRRARQGRRDVSSEELFGTVLTLKRSKWVEETWGGEVGWIPFDGNSANKIDDAPRLLEVFLDHLSAQSQVGALHLMDPKYDAVLSDGERELRDALTDLERGLSKAAGSGAAWTELQLLLRKLGSQRGTP